MFDKYNILCKIKNKNNVIRVRHRLGIEVEDGNEARDWVMVEDGTEQSPGLGTSPSPISAKSRSGSKVQGLSLG